MDPTLSAQFNELYRTTQASADIYSKPSLEEFTGAQNIISDICVSNPYDKNNSSLLQRAIVVAKAQLARAEAEAALARAKLQENQDALNAAQATYDACNQALIDANTKLSDDIEARDDLVNSLQSLLNAQSTAPITSADTAFTTMVTDQQATVTGNELTTLNTWKTALLDPTQPLQTRLDTALATLATASFNPELFTTLTTATTASTDLLTATDSMYTANLALSKANLDLDNSKRQLDDLNALIAEFGINNVPQNLIVQRDIHNTNYQNFLTLKNNAQNAFDTANAIYNTAYNQFTQDNALLKTLNIQIGTTLGTLVQQKITLCMQQSYSQLGAYLFGISNGMVMNADTLMGFFESRTPSSDVTAIKSLLTQNSTSFDNAWTQLQTQYPNLVTPSTYNYMSLWYQKQYYNQKKDESLNMRQSSNMAIVSVTAEIAETQNTYDVYCSSHIEAALSTATTASTDLLTATDSLYTAKLALSKATTDAAYVKKQIDVLDALITQFGESQVPTYVTQRDTLNTTYQNLLILQSEAQSAFDTANTAYTTAYDAFNSATTTLNTLNSQLSTNLTSLIQQKMTLRMQQFRNQEGYYIKDLAFSTADSLQDEKHNLEFTIERLDPNILRDLKSVYSSNSNSIELAWAQFKILYPSLGGKPMFFRYLSLLYLINTYFFNQEMSSVVEVDSSLQAIADANTAIAAAQSTYDTYYNSLVSTPALREAQLNIYDAYTMTLAINDLTIVDIQQRLQNIQDTIITPAHNRALDETLSQKDHEEAVRRYNALIAIFDAAIQAYNDAVTAYADAQKAIDEYNTTIIPADQAAVTDAQNDLTEATEELSDAQIALRVAQKKYDQALKFVAVKQKVLNILENLSKNIKPGNAGNTKFLPKGKTAKDLRMMI